MNLTNAEVMRYGRHLIMPEVGVAGQEKLKAAKILMVGAGGLGSPAGLYLAASGVGEITIIDADVVDISNLQRQVIHDTSSVGSLKVESAKKRIHEVNPHVKVNIIADLLTNDNVRQLVREHDLVVDGTDNFQTRYMVNDACIFEGKLNVYASIFQFDGQATVFCAEDGPCYRCLYPEPPPPGMVPSCAEGGVLGVLPGMVGILQATEAIKIILGKGKPLIGRLLLYDALEMSFRELKVRKDPDCPVCGPNKTITDLQNYEYFCGVHTDDNAEEPQENAEEPQETVPQISAKETQELLDSGAKVTLLDVRDDREWEINRLPGAVHIPVDEIPERMNELDTADDIVVYCHFGPRSVRAINFLKKMGFGKLKNLTGGIDAWSTQVDESVPRY